MTLGFNDRIILLLIFLQSRVDTQSNLKSRLSSRLLQKASLIHTILNCTFLFPHLNAPSTKLPTPPFLQPLPLHLAPVWLLLAPPSHPAFYSAPRSHARRVGSAACRR